jgi:hypothetical protein
MLTTDALLAIAFLLAVLAAIGVRIALSLRDLGSALDRIAERMGQAPAFPARLAEESPEARPEEAPLDETEIAAVIATAARFAGTQATKNTDDERKQR